MQLQNKGGFMFRQIQSADQLGKLWNALSRFAVLSLFLSCSCVFADHCSETDQQPATTDEQPATSEVDATMDSEDGSTSSTGEATEN